jgi:hypothetical protein
MTKNDYQHFVCIVAGDNPEELLKEYDKNKNVDEYILYKYKDANILKNTYIKEYEKELEHTNNEVKKEFIIDEIEYLKEISDDEFFTSLFLEKENEGAFYDKNTGDIMSKTNPKGRFSFYNIGKIFSIPFINKNGEETFQCIKKDIDWSKIHLANCDVYSRVWEMVMDNSTPNNEDEKVLYDNMKDKTSYFEKFETKENYITSNTAFWGYAFLSEKTGWIDATDIEDQFAWMSNFYDVFIKNLSENTKLTIYECTK